MIINHSATVYTQPSAQLLLGDAHTVLTGIPDGMVDMVVTSPPYYGVRDYGTGQWTAAGIDCDHRDAISIGEARRSGEARLCPTCGAEWIDEQHGLEPTPQDYVDGMCRVFDQVHRVLKNDGVLFLNIGDSYASGITGREDAAVKYPGMQATLASRADRVHRTETGLPKKNLLGIPWMIAFALQASGWILRNDIIWAKTNPMPNSVRDRFSSTHEHIFMLTKNQRYHFDLDAVRVPHKTVNLRSFAKTSSDNQSAVFDRPTGDGSGKYANAARDLFAGRDHGRAIAMCGGHRAGHPLGKNPGDVWNIATRGLKEAHFATYPIDIPMMAIKAGSRPGSVILDPFSGAATTGVAALQLGRRYVGIDLNPDYQEIAKRRLSGACA